MKVFAGHLCHVEKPLVERGVGHAIMHHHFERRLFFEGGNHGTDQIGCARLAADTHERLFLVHVGLHDVNGFHPAQLGVCRRQMILVHAG
jgi:hypothetical protein